MIRGFETPVRLEPQGRDRLQWGRAFAASLLAGLILLAVPRGSPWSAVTFFSPVVLGWSIPGQMPLILVWLLHLAVCVVSGLIVCRVIAGLRQGRAIATGGLLGLVLYVMNFGVVSTWWPETRGNELSVLFTHIVFGLVVAGSYRGLLRRNRSAVGSM
jgi:hypothetical protein